MSDFIEIWIGSLLFKKGQLGQKVLSIKAVLQSFTLPPLSYIMKDIDSLHDVIFFCFASTLVNIRPYKKPWQFSLYFDVKYFYDEKKF